MYGGGGAGYSSYGSGYPSSYGSTSAYGGGMMGGMSSMMGGYGGGSMIGNRYGYGSYGGGGMNRYGGMGMEPFKDPNMPPENGGFMQSMEQSVGMVGRISQLLQMNFEVGDS